MELPRVDPVGRVEYPEGWVSRPRRLSPALRLAALGLLLAFVGVATVTTVASLGRYCLTSHASAPSPLQQP